MYRVRFLGHTQAKTLSPKEHTVPAQNWEEIAALMDQNTESNECFIEELEDSNWLFEAHFLKFAGMWQPVV